VLNAHGAPKVRVNALGVGMVRTELTSLHYEDLDAVEKTVPLGPERATADAVSRGGGQRWSGGWFTSS
jgi:hypothetical protein